MGGRSEALAGRCPGIQPHLRTARRHTDLRRTRIGIPDIGAPCPTTDPSAPPICCRVSQNELCVLNIVATYQSQSRLHCRALINWMVPGHAVSNLISDIDQVARGLFDAGYILETLCNSAYAGARLEHSLQSVH
jgi:hypothetical protein